MTQSLSAFDKKVDPFPKFDEINQNLLIKLAVNDENEMNTLLSYYRKRLAEFDQERQEWLEKLEILRHSQEEKHKSDWELQKRNKEIAELQKSLSELKLSLFDERQHILKLKKENDLLKIKELEDRKKIAELLSMTNSVEEEVFMFKDLRPDVNTKTTKNDLNIYRNKENFDKTGNVATFMKSSKGVYGNKPKNVIKTIYLPNEQLNTVAFENESLRKQIEEQNKLFSEEIAGLKEEISVKIDEASLRMNYDQTIIKNLEEKLHKKENHLVDITKEYFAYRLKSNEIEKKLHEENEILRLRNAALANRLLIFTKQNEIDNKVSKELAEKKTDEYTTKFRNQIRNKEENIQLIKDQYSKIQEIYLERIKELEDNLTQLSQKYHRLEQKKSLEIEGLKEDIKRLKSQAIMNSRPELASYAMELNNEDSPHFEKERNTKINEKNDNKETRKKNFHEIKKISPEKELIREKVKEDMSNESNLEESVNLEDLENIKKQLDDLEAKLDFKKK